MQLPGVIAADRRNAVSVVTLLYLGDSAIRVRGSASGRYYEFSKSRPRREIDARDAASFLRTHFFRLLAG
jgi:hypothetical protein